MSLIYSNKNANRNKHDERLENASNKCRSSICIKNESESNLFFATYATHILYVLFKSNEFECDVDEVYAATLMTLVR